jgi:EAL domain-containing protein (putative c-di-GMP-specific phosphodiesterase class I)
VVGLDSSVRWPHPTRGVVEPDDFLPVAEDTGLTVPMGRWSLREACRRWTGWRRSGAGDLTVGVGLSHRQFWDPGLAQSVAEALAETGAPASALVLSVGAGVVRADLAAAAGVLGSLRREGVRVMLASPDTSTMDMLPSLPVDALRIPAAALTDAAATARALVARAGQLGLAVEADVVASPEQAARLAELGCVRALLSPPVRAGDVPAALRHAGPVQAALTN